MFLWRKLPSSFRWRRDRGGNVVVLIKPPILARRRIPRAHRRAHCHGDRIRQSRVRNPSSRELPQLGFSYAPRRPPRKMRSSGESPEDVRQTMTIARSSIPVDPRSTPPSDLRAWHMRGITRRQRQRIIPPALRRPGLPRRLLLPERAVRSARGLLAVPAPDPPVAQGSGRDCLRAVPTGDGRRP